MHVNLTARNDTGRLNTSPVTTMTPVVRLKWGCNHTITIPGMPVVSWYPACSHFCLYVLMYAQSSFSSSSSWNLFLLASTPELWTSLIISPVLWNKSAKSPVKSISPLCIKLLFFFGRRFIPSLEYRKQRWQQPCLKCSKDSQGDHRSDKVIYRVFKKFLPIVNCILRKAFNASFSKCKLIQVRNLS